MKRVSNSWGRMIGVAAALALATSFSAISGAQQASNAVARSANELPDTWFVQFSSPPSADGTDSATLNKDLTAFRAAAATAGIVYTERQSFQTLWNGVSVNASSSEIAKVKSLPGVTAIYPVRKVYLDASRDSSGIDLASAIKMTGADVVQNSLGYTGAGIKVAVMDTGIDYNHPDLGGCFGPGCRVAKGYDFVGDAYDAETNPVPVPDNDPDDCNGHGTHVSGIIGANGAVKGVAPGVTFFAYRVFGCEGSTSDEIMLAAMERAAQGQGRRPEHEHRLLASMAAVADRAGRGPPREAGRRRGGVNRQQRPRRIHPVGSVRGERAGRRRKRNWRGGVRQHNRQPDRVHDLTGRQEDRLQRGRGCAPATYKWEWSPRGDRADYRLRRSIAISRWEPYRQDRVDPPGHLHLL